MSRPLSHNGLIELKVKNGDPRETYAGLLWMQQRKGYNHGWVAQKFKSIFGKWPRPLTNVEPVPPNMELREWIGIMNTRYRAKMKRQEARMQELRDNDMLPSFMTPEDWDVRL
jgi:hypothetical protein